MLGLEFLVVIWLELVVFLHQHGFLPIKVRMVSTAWIIGVGVWIALTLVVNIYDIAYLYCKGHCSHERSFQQIVVSVINERM